MGRGGLAWEAGTQSPPLAAFPGETQPLTQEAGLCAFAPSCLPAPPSRPLLQCLGAWPFSHWAPCLGQGQHFIAREDEMCSFEMSAPTGSHTGEKEVGQKSWAALWCAGGFIQMICSACVPGGMAGLLGMQDLASWWLQDWGERLPLWGMTVHVLQLNVQGRQADAG